MMGQCSKTLLFGGRLERMKCLIADDAALIRNMLKNILVTMEFEQFAEAGNGKEALALYKKDRPDLVLMDITMPEMNGLEAIKAIINFDPSAVIVVCSSMGQKGIVLEAVQAGAKYFIIKPFEDDKVKEVIHSVLV
jgi:two-component system chemotaxis response regulator CheY